MKRTLGRMACLLMVMSGCAMQPYVEPPLQPLLLRRLPDGGRLESVSSTGDKCQPDQIVYVNESKNDRQIVVNWNTLSERKRYTLTSVGRSALMDRIRATVRGCSIPIRVEYGMRDFTRLDTGEEHIGAAFLRYTLQAERIELQAVQFDIQRDPATGKMTFIPERVDFNRWNDLYVPNLIDQVYNDPVAIPQVAYRIDDHRFFEVVPRNDSPCFRARLYYTDTARGIHANIASWDNLTYGDFIIDANNDQYLVAPVIKSNPGCQSGGGYACSNRLYYSQDGGREWKVTRSNTGSGMILKGSTLYVSIRNYGGWKVDISTDIPNDKKWDTYSHLEPEPDPIKAPLDNRFRCSNE